MRRYRIHGKARGVAGSELLTDELLNQIVNSRTLDSVLDSSAGAGLDLITFLNGKLEESGLSKAQVIRDSHVNVTHGYQIFSGERKGSRDKMLALAFALKLDLHDTQLLLMLSDAGALYSKNTRDAIIIFCISHGCDLNRADEELYVRGEKTISDDGDS